ncbi:MAG TPA: hypothetical protein ENL23_00260 [Candidatus Acetothermia bacterium]|nr:hypothetical protein [Candidatus Acetothermia bacterium]
MSTTWGYIQLITAIGLLLMFVGCAREYTRSEVTILPQMSEEQVLALLGSPDQIHRANEAAGENNLYAWIYYDPYRVIFYENGNVTHSARSNS